MNSLPVWVFSRLQKYWQSFMLGKTRIAGMISSFLMLLGNQTLSEKSHSDFQQSSFYKRDQLDGIYLSWASI